MNIANFIQSQGHDFFRLGKVSDLISSFSADTPRFDSTKELSNALLKYDMKFDQAIFPGKIENQTQHLIDQVMTFGYGNGDPKINPFTGAQQAFIPFDFSIPFGESSLFSAQSVLGMNSIDGSQAFRVLGGALPTPVGGNDHFLSSGGSYGFSMFQNPVFQNTGFQNASGSQFAAANPLWLGLI